MVQGKHNLEIGHQAILQLLNINERLIQKISFEGVKKLLDLIENKEVPKELYYTNTELLIRDSIGKIK